VSINLRAPHLAATLIPCEQLPEFLVSINLRASHLVTTLTLCELFISCEMLLSSSLSAVTLGSLLVSSLRGFLVRHFLGSVPVITQELSSPVVLWPLVSSLSLEGGSPSGPRG
jgi:hypothetical protein